MAAGASAVNPAEAAEESDYKAYRLKTFACKGSGTYNREVQDCLNDFRQAT